MMNDYPTQQRGVPVNKKIASDQMIVFWQSARIPRKDALAAFDAEGMAHFIPEVDHYTALKKSASDVVDAHALYSGGKVKDFALSGKADSVGVEIRRVVKGQKRNELPFLFSLGACDQGDGTYAIEVLDVDATLCPQVANNQMTIACEADRFWRDACDYVTANDLTNAITQMVKASHGFLALDHGVVWYLPADMHGPYSRIAAALAHLGVKMHMCVFDPVVNDDLMQHVSGELVRRSMLVFEGQIDQAADMQHRGAKPRSNGQQTRLEQWIATKETLDHNRSLLGRAFSAISKAAMAAREAIGEEALKALAG
jgi:hypothetical protein